MRRGNIAVTMTTLLFISLSLTGCVEDARMYVESTKPAVTAGVADAETQKPDSESVEYVVKYPKIQITRESKTFKSEDGNAELCYVTFERASVDPIAYPELAKALKQWFDTNEADMKRKGKFLTEDATEISKEKADDMMCVIQQNISQKRADSKVLSMELNHYEFRGGTHGQTKITGLTFDTSTGKELAQSDIITDQKKFDSDVTEYIISEAEKMFGEGVFQEYKETIKSQMNNLSWMLTDYGMQVVFQEYDIAPYAAGPVRIDIPYELLKNSMAAKYLPD